MDINVSKRPIRTQITVASLLAFLCLSLFCGCGNGKKLPEEVVDSADQVVKNAVVRRSERGYLQTILEAPLIKRYTQPRPTTEYTGNDEKRVKLTVYGDNGNKVTATIEAGRAVSFDDRDIMEAYDSVVVVDFKNGDTIYLHDLIWNAQDDRIYSNHTVRARNGRRLTVGDGFVSNQKMDSLHIIGQRGVLEFNE